MAVCGPDMIFYNIDAHWPGSTHDSRVMKNSELYRKFEVNDWAPLPGGIILGDSAYALTKWLITPVVRPSNGDQERQSQQRFLQSHKKTRRVIECAFGILKEKFLCLMHLRVNPVYAAKIFKCCAALCNFIRKGEEGLDLQRFVAVLRNEEVVDQDGQYVENDENDAGGVVKKRAAEVRLQELFNHFL